MKKSISYFSLALVMLGNVALASNVTNNSSKISFSYETASDVNPLCMAISKGDIATVKQIIAYGIDLNDCTNRGMTPLMFAAIYNQTEIAKLLIEKGADLSKKDKSGSTALDHAKASGSTAVLEVLQQSKKRK
jgi:ankyrin repeat protein